MSHTTKNVFNSSINFKKIYSIVDSLSHEQLICVEAYETLRPNVPCVTFLQTCKLENIEVDMLTLHLVETSICWNLNLGLYNHM